MAERLRRGIEKRSGWKGVTLTCSIGIASWPADGVMPEEIIRSADAALYYAKQMGRNHISLACEVALSEVLRMEAGLQRQDPDSVINTIYALAATVDARDHHTYGHSMKVSKYAVDIATAMGYSTVGIERIRAEAMLHDIGKIGINDEILAKEGPLSGEEQELIESHPALGVAILKHVDNLKDCLPGVLHHHERFDGCGYPYGLKGENIPLDARILAVANACDAMTSERPYKTGKLTHEQAIAELIRCSGTQFDPTVIKVFSGFNTTAPKHGIQDKKKDRKSSF